MAWSLEDLLHVAAVVGDAPLGPGPHVQYGPVDHGWVEQRNLVADVLLQLIQGLKTLDLRYPHKKKSSGDKSGDLGGQFRTCRCLLLMTRPWNCD